MKKQHGFSIFGLVFMLAILSGVVSILIKVLPPYMDFITIADATQQTLEQPRISLQTQDNIRKKIATNLSINNIQLGAYGEDAIVLRREDGEMLADIDYTVEQPVFEGEEVQMVLHMHFARTVGASVSAE
jgi:hypothetical protein